MIQNYINHIVFVVDKSGSMSHLSKEVVKVFDSQISHLATRSKELNQETRVSVYLFDDQVECLIYDMDVMRLPSLVGYYKIGGNTALIDATLKSIEDLQKTPELYGDHAFLEYVLTDGEENRSRNRPNALLSKITELANNWTVAVLVPDQRGVFEAKKFGFPADNIQIWLNTNEGIKEIGETIRYATDNFMRARSTGVRSTKSLFNLDISKLDLKTIKIKLEELQSHDYELLNVYNESDIKTYVESWIKTPYIKGSSYYQITKPEVIQTYKQICIQDKVNGKVYSGLNGRKMLGLPDFEVKVNPALYGQYDIFVQSTSVNRKLVKGTKLLVLK